MRMQSRQSHQSRRGVAIIIVLVFATVLLTFGTFYINVLGAQRPMNDTLQRKVQADFLTQGIANIAILKFKELPSDFYYAYQIAKVATPTTIRIPGPLNDYHADTLLKGSETDPQDPTKTVSWEATYQVLSQDRYNQDTIRINVTVNVGGVIRDAHHLITATRRRIP